MGLSSSGFGEAPIKASDGFAEVQMAALRLLYPAVIYLNHFLFCSALKVSPAVVSLPISTDHIPNIVCSAHLELARFGLLLLFLTVASISFV